MRRIEDTVEDRIDLDQIAEQSRVVNHSSRTTPPDKEGTDKHVRADSQAVDRHIPWAERFFPED